MMLTQVDQVIYGLPHDQDGRERRLRSLPSSIYTSRLSSGKRSRLLRCEGGSKEPSLINHSRESLLPYTAHSPRATSTDEEDQLRHTRAALNLCQSLGDVRKRPHRRYPFSRLSLLPGSDSSKAVPRHNDVLSTPKSYSLYLPEGGLN